MAYRFEDIVTTLENTSSVFALAGDMDIFKEGLADLARRVRALESAMAKTVKTVDMVHAG